VHLAAFLGVLLLVQAPRLGGWAATLAKPVFPSNRTYVDFDNGYYPAAQTIRRDPSQLYRGTTYNQRTGQFHLPTPARFVNIPLVAWLFVPLTALPLPQAGTLLLVINIGIALACLFLLQRRAASSPPALRWAITLAFVTSGPLMNTLNLGQTTLLILLMLLLGERRLARGADVSAGLWLGFAALIKIPVLLFVPYFMWRRRWRVAGAATGVFLLAAVVSILCYGWALHTAYYNAAIRPYTGTAVAAHNCQSIRAVLARLFTDTSLTWWQPIPIGRVVRLVEGVLLAALLFLCAWALWPPGRIQSYRRMLFELGVVMCVGLLALPISWAHYGIWLLPVAVIAGGGVPSITPRASHAPWLLAALLPIAILLINFPVLPAAIITSCGDHMWFRVAVSHQALGTALLLGLVVWSILRGLMVDPTSQIGGSLRTVQSEAQYLTEAGD
jgi:alpha-1,2-mannosyltransferase